MDKVMIQLTFTEETDKGQYRDALYFTPEDYAAKTPEQLTTLKQARVDNWKNILDNPVSQVEPTLSDYIESRNNLMRQIEDCSDKIDKLGTKEDLTVIQTEYEDKVQKIKDRIVNKG